MPEIRPHKRLRRQITETSAEDDNDASSDYNAQDHDTIYVRAQDPTRASTPNQVSKSAAMYRPRRSGASAASPSEPASPAITVSRSPSGSPEDSRKSIKLNFKMPASKLREVVGARPSAGQRKNVSINSRDSFEGGEIIPGPRSSRTQRKMVEYKEYDEDDDEEEEEEEDDDDDDAELEEEEDDDDDDDEMDDFDQVGAEAEGGTDDEDMEMKEAPSVPTQTTVKIKAPKPPPATSSAKSTSQSISRPASRPSSKPVVKVTKPVEEKEMELDPEDDEISEIDKDEDDEEEEEDDDDDEEEEEDAEGEEDDEMNDTTLPTAADGEGEDDDEMLDSDDELANIDGSGASTPDYAKLTKRQRGKAEDEGSFMALPMEPQIKKHFTAEEHRMRRAEMARRRKNLSEKRNEEEKMTTINKLLKKQTTKKRGKALNPETLAAQAASEGGGGGGGAATNAAGSEEPEDDDEIAAAAAEPEHVKADPLFLRWVSGKEGVRLGVPEEWAGKKALVVGGLFESHAAAELEGGAGTGAAKLRGRLVEEV